jgi:hypothetical protein
MQLENKVAGQVILSIVYIPDVLVTNTDLNRLYLMFE